MSSEDWDIEITREIRRLAPDTRPSWANIVNKVVQKYVKKESKICYKRRQAWPHFVNKAIQDRHKELDSEIFQRVKDEEA